MNTNKIGYFCKGYSLKLVGKTIVYMGFWSKFFTTSKNADKHAQVEDYYRVEVTAKSLTVAHPKRPTEQIDWDKIEEIVLVNTNEGPFLPDVWLILTGNEKGCSIPQGSKGFEQVYDIVSKYEGFNFENVIKSACCVDNKTFCLWKRAD